MPKYTVKPGASLFWDSVRYNGGDTVEMPANCAPARAHLLEPQEAEKAPEPETPAGDDTPKPKKRSRAKSKAKVEGDDG